MAIMRAAAAKLVQRLRHHIRAIDFANAVNLLLATIAKARWCKLIINSMAFALFHDRREAALTVTGNLASLKTSRSWQALSDDPHFKLTFKPFLQPVGLCRVSLRVTQQGGPITSKLYFDDGLGFRESLSASVTLDSNEQIAQQVYVPFGVTAIRWDPTERSGDLEIEPPVFRPLSALHTLCHVFLIRSRTHRNWFTAGGLAAFRRLLPRIVAEADLQSAPSHYRSFLRQLERDPAEARLAAAAHMERFDYRPCFSIILPTYNTPVRFLERAIQSVIDQCYADWELCIADDASPDAAMRAQLRRLAARDSRIKLTERSTNGGISEASNDALKLAIGEFVAFLDHDDELHELALYHVAAALNTNRQLDFIYSDEDKISPEGERYDPNFKPDWDPYLLWSQNYVAHLCVYRTKLVLEAGGLRKSCDGSQDLDLVLRVSGLTTSPRIHHIPAVLYHWRAIPGSTALSTLAKSYPHEAGMRALREHFANQPGVHVRSGDIPCSYRVDFPLPAQVPRASIIIPTRDGYAHLRHCIASLLDRTDYPDYELLIVDNQSRDPETLMYFEVLSQNPRVRVLSYDKPFNFSSINNFAAQAASGSVLVLLNDDTSVISRDWLREMVSLAIRADVGAVGAKLYYPDDTVQHAGVALGIGGVAGHLHLFAPRTSAGYMSRLSLRQTMSAVTGACLAVEAEKYWAVDGLDEAHLAVAFNDIDFCLKLGARGWPCVWTPWAELYHHESKSRGTDTAPGKRERFQREVEYMMERWRERLHSDPYYNRHFSRMRNDYAFAEIPRPLRPWEQDLSGVRAPDHCLSLAAVDFLTEPLRQGADT